MESAAIGAKLEDYLDKTATDYVKICQRCERWQRLSEENKTNM